MDGIHERGVVEAFDATQEMNGANLDQVTNRPR
jgi:hypothetical protein